MIRRLLNDLSRMLLPLLLGIALIAFSEPLALLLHLPAVAPAGVLCGMALCGVALTHPMRRLLFSYVNLRTVYRKAIESSSGSGHVFMGVCIVLAALLLVLGGSAKADTLPPNAVTYLPVLQAELHANWPTMPMPSALAAQVEQESCVSLKSPRCWSPRAELHTAREQGVGLGQITRTDRFDSLAELRKQFPKQLTGWDWGSDSLYDPHYQLRGLILMDMRNWHAVLGTSTPTDRLAMSFAAYNGGLGGLVRDRALCGGTAGCDPSKWFTQVELTCTKSKVAAPGYGKSWCDINREYPRNVLLVRRAKYVTAMGG